MSAPLRSPYGIDLLHGSLWQGGKPEARLADDAREFDTLVLCAYEVQFAGERVPGLRIIRCPMDDATLSNEEAAAALSAAEAVVAELKRGRRVLCTCHQGRNRSGLVSAMALVGTYGMRPSQAIRLIQSRRKNALENPSFTHFLLGPERAGRL